MEISLSGVFTLLYAFSADSEEAGGRGLSAGQIGGLVAGLIAAVIVAILVATIIAYAAYYKKTHVTTV